MHVYVIGPKDGPYKIGMTMDIERRLKQLQYRSKVDLIIHFKAEVPTRKHATIVEAIAHEYVRANCLSGEWFACPLERAQEGIEKGLNGINGMPSPEPEPPADFSPESIAAFIDHMNWSDRECARKLGCAQNSILAWRKNGAPKYIGYACAALACGLPAWEPHRIDPEHIERWLLEQPR